ncbi:unnamed protein product [Amoebophrya sp. A120]|nr:unnamed protein product [Amoebophrya sp. A120]|eukprot:GSA120T00020896001.1
MSSQPYDRSRQAYSQLQRERLSADCSYYLPDVLRNPKRQIDEKSNFEIDDRIKALFPTTCQSKAVQFVPGGTLAGSAPLRIGAVLSGGQAPGGHNIVVGIYDQAKRIHPDSVVFGFLDGPHGIFASQYVQLNDEIIDGFRNTGGFDMLGSGRHKIETPEQFENSLKCCLELNLDGLVVIGGDDSNTNGAVLAEYFRSKNVKTKVVGCPKTIDGDLKVPPYIPVSFGFDTACRTYAELVGNVAVDSLSAQKYYHFVRLMGRSASNIALEVALQTCANVCLIGEEVAEKKQTLKELTTQIVDVICKRHKEQGKHYGVILLPEGLIEFIPEFEALIKDINEILAKDGIEATEASVVPHLEPQNKEAFLYLPEFIRGQLLLDRDPHGNVQVAKIETEKLLAATVRKELEEKFGEKLAHMIFNPQFHSFGYEGRAGLPSFFDASYCYALGSTASSLLANNETGMIASVKNLLAPIAEWECGGVPVTALCVIERRKGKDKAVIEKALVDMSGAPYKIWTSLREKLALADCYRIPGPLQFSRDCPHSQEIPITLALELGGGYKFPVQDAALTSYKIDFPTQGDKFLQFGNRPRSELQAWRSTQPYAVPKVFADGGKPAVVAAEDKKCSIPCAKYVPSISAVSGLVHLGAGETSTTTDCKVGIIYCGRQTPGAADVVVGLAECLQKLEAASPAKKKVEVLGFVGGTAGFYTKSYLKLTADVLANYKKTGGFELLGRSEDRFNELDKIKAVCKELQLTGLVLVGGCTTATDACYLAENLYASNISVVAVPASMGGELSNAFCEQPLGFDSVTKATARLVGNTAIDGSSARKYWYFLRSMEGPTHSSHVTLEVGLQTKPNHLVLGEQVLQEGFSLKEIVSQIADVVENRWQNGKKNFGTVLIPDGLLFNVMELRVLISELDKLHFGRLGLCSRTTQQFGDSSSASSSDGDFERISSSAEDNGVVVVGETITEKKAKASSTPDVDKVAQLLTPFSRALLQQLPDYVVHGMLDAKLRGNSKVNLALIETDRMLADMVKLELKSRASYKGSFSPVCQFLGYQSRCTMPSDFDSNYGYALGCASASLILAKKTGYLATLSSLSKPVAEWHAGGVPLSALLSVPLSTTTVAAASYVNSTNEKTLPKIQPARVDLSAEACKAWSKIAGQCAAEEMYENPGPVQFIGDCASRISEQLKIAEKDYFSSLNAVKRLLADIEKECPPGCNPKRLRVANSSLENLKLVLEQIP